MIFRKMLRITRLVNQQYLLTTHFVYVDYVIKHKHLLNVCSVQIILKVTKNT